MIFCVGSKQSRQHETSIIVDVYGETIFISTREYTNDDEDDALRKTPLIDSFCVSLNVLLPFGLGKP